MNSQFFADLFFEQGHTVVEYPSHYVVHFNPFCPNAQANFPFKNRDDQSALLVFPKSRKLHPVIVAQLCKYLYETPNCEASFRFL